MAPTFSTAVQNPTGTCKLAMMANPILSQEKLWKLFNIVPGLEYCELTQVMQTQRQPCITRVGRLLNFQEKHCKYDTPD